MPERPDNIFRFRRLKWGAPKRLEGLKAIDGTRPAAPVPRSIGGGSIGLVLVGAVAGLAIVMGVLGWF